jgi:cell division septation protein DedD
MEQEVAALGEQTAGPELDRLRERMEEFGERADDIDDLKTEVRALRAAISEQTGRIEALNGRLDKLEQARTASPGSDSSQESSTQASTQSGDGSWVINLITVGDRASAESFQERLEKLGATSRIEPVTVEDKTLLRVVVPGFESRQAARNAGAELKDQLKLTDDPWITRQ